METNLSRRGFLTGAAAAGALAAMGLAGCAPTPAAEGGTKTADTGAAAATSWRDKPEMPTEFVETVDADIVVVGAGNGGLVAATTAAQNGAKVVVLEKAGAIAAAREAIGALNSKLAPDHQEDVPTLLNHANQTQAGDANMLMYKTWAEKSGEMIEWMADTLGPKGMLFPFEWHCPDDPHAYYPAMCYNPCLDEYNPDGPNYTSYTHLEVVADVFTTDLGGEIRFETPAQQLLIDEAGRVTGVVAEGKEGFIQVNAAKGVIICTGGYGANNEMLADLAPGNSAWCALRDSVTETGDGIRMVLWLSLIHISCPRPSRSCAPPTPACPSRSSSRSRPSSPTLSCRCAPTGRATTTRVGASCPGRAPSATATARSLSLIHISSARSSARTAASWLC